MARFLSTARGYTLIEMAIALSVLALLLTGTLVPVQSLMQEERIDRAKAEVDKVHKALMGYALRSRTPSRVLEEAITPSNAGDIVMRGGRPYLPCPDINGDGLEDRVTGSNLVTISQSLAEPGSGSQSPIVGGPGSCVQNKGILPWRTVGTSPRDPWGNYYTYYVDIAFSNSVLGFDENSRADVFDPRRIESGAYVRRQQGISNTGDRPYVMPAIICSRDCESANAGDFLSTELWGGADITAAVARPYRQNEAVDGPVFVVVSHGPNGAGAVNGWQDPVNLGAAMRCNAPPQNSNNDENLAEVENASYSRDDNICGHSGAFTALSSQSNRFVYAVEGGGDAGRGLMHYDDIVRWMSANAMFAKLARAGFFNTGKKDGWHLQ